MKSAAFLLLSIYVGGMFTSFLITNYMFSNVKGCMLSIAGIIMCFVFFDINLETYRNEKRKQKRKQTAKKVARLKKHKKKL